MIKKLKEKIKLGMEGDVNRVEWVEKILKELPSGLKILDVGAGEQRFKNFCSHLEYVSQDFGKYEGRGDNKGLQTGNWDQGELNLVSDILEIPVPDGSFDVILCTEVFEHIPEPVLAIQEFSRILKKGGYLILTSPFVSGTHFSPFYFYSGFSRYFYEEFLTRNRFEIIEIKNNGNFYQFLAQEIRRLPFIARTYEKDRLRFWEYPILLLIILILRRWSKKGNSSAEFLCFGFFVRAIKK